jgi:hypothetical protein
MVFVSERDKIRSETQLAVVALFHCIWSAMSLFLYLYKMMYKELVQNHSHINISLSAFFGIRIIKFLQHDFIILAFQKVVFSYELYREL